MRSRIVFEIAELASLPDDARRAASDDTSTWSGRRACGNHGGVPKSLTTRRRSRNVVEPILIRFSMKRALLLCVLVVWCLVLGERAALAYVDPNSGSMLLQVILGGAAGIALIVRLYWRRFLSLIGLRERETTRDDTNG
jgi:hypothetical protein